VIVIIPFFYSYAVYSSYQAIGSYAIFPIACSIISCFFDASFGIIYGRIYRKHMFLKDKRMRALDETLQGISSI
jgi:hypothetical protein